ILRVDHPDIMEFITCKEDSNKLNNFNISVALTDKFMAALDQNGEFDLLNPKTGESCGQLKARDVWEKIVNHAWQNGDPGIVFIDRMNQYNPTPHIGAIESTNPCGEQPLLPYESCNLGSINLAKFVKEGKIDFERLGDVVKIATRFLDDVIDMNKYPIPEIDKMTKSNRKIGLGVMGWADMLLILGIPYNSTDAINLAERVMKFIKEQADKTSTILAKEKGVFPNFEGSIYDTPESAGIRNATRTTIAPTGTLSIIGSCSSGIEPLFALAYVRKSHIGKKGGDEWVELIEANPYFEEVAKERDFYTKDLMEKISKEGTIKEISEVPEDIRRVFVTSHDISPEWHIRMQAAFQKYVDNAVSKTINFPHSATREDVAKAYLLAYETGCKGITIYRDGSRDVQVLTTGKSHATDKKEMAQLPAMPLTKRERPVAMKGTTYKINTSYGDLYVTINDDDQGKPFEVFATIGKAGGFFSAKSEGVCRLISLALRSGIPVEDVIKQIKGIRGPMPSWSEWGMVLSLPDAIAQILEHHLTKNQPKLDLEFHGQEAVPNKEGAITPEINIPKPTPKPNGNGLNIKRSIADFGTAPECPECGNVLEISEGCLKCQTCGFSKCG
ncbi:MAG: adenosylcobalamin-dependent ribonucleoside-diphosphate reductase, partial [Candidatus Buchananbacteria bacterium]